MHFCLTLYIVESAVDYEPVYRVLGRADYANFSLKLVAAGQPRLFPSFSPLTRSQLTMVMTTLLCITVSLEMAWYFQNLFGASSGIGFAQMASKNASTWVRVLSSGISSLLILIV